MFTSLPRIKVSTKTITIFKLQIAFLIIYVCICVAAIAPYKQRKMSGIVVFPISKKKLKRLIGSIAQLSPHNIFFAQCKLYKTKISKIEITVAWNYVCVKEAVEQWSLGEIWV